MIENFELLDSNGVLWGKDNDRCYFFENTPLHWKKIGGFHPLNELDSAYTDLRKFHLGFGMNPDNMVCFGEAETPLIEIKFRGKGIKVKLDYLFMSGSYKDRGAILLVSRLAHMGVKSIVEDSSGNAGAAIASYARRAGLECTIVAADSANERKLSQIKRMGVDLRLVNGNREDVSKYASGLALQDLYYASHVYEPDFFLGMQSFIYEIWLQNKGYLPNNIFLPVGNGTLFLGTYYGLLAMLEAGAISSLPKVHAVQSEACPSLVKSAENCGHTIADGIAARKPFRKHEILRALNHLKSDIVLVTEFDIQSAYQCLWNQGIGCEYSGAVGFAGWIKYGMPMKSITSITGSGLKA
jgi:threonine synthase